MHLTIEGGELIHDVQNRKCNDILSTAAATLPQKGCVMRRIKYFLVFAAVLVAAAMFSVGCAKNPVGPTTEVVSDFGLPTADSTGVQSIKPGATPMATPPNFNGWSVVSGYQTILFGPLWDQDWKVVFYLPNRSTMPRYVNVAAKNMAGTWYNYTGYVMLYDKAPSGSYYKVTYVFGGNRALAFGINMLDSRNWAMYYHD